MNISLRNRTSIKKILTWGGVGVLAFGGITLLAKRALSQPATIKDERQSIQAPRASQTLNKEFSFSIKDAKEAELTKIKVVLESAELRDEIIVKAQRVVAIKGRTFLVLSVKMTNDSNKTLAINARDYVRLSVNEKDKELMAPEIHNDPVEIQAISTKQTRLGFPINDTDKKLTLHVGELDGKKESIMLAIR